MKIIVLRHEKTDYNVKGLIQGLTDAPLNEEGTQNCQKLRKELEKYHIDYVIASPLTRTRVTASLVSSAPLFLDERLTERNLGLFEGKPVSSYNRQTYSDYNKNSTEEGVESVRDVLERVFDLLDEVVSQDFDTVLLVTHGGVLQYVPYYFLGLPEDGILDKYRVDNGQYLIFER